MSAYSFTVDANWEGALMLRGVHKFAVFVIGTLFSVLSICAPKKDLGVASSCHGPAAARQQGKKAVLITGKNTKISKNARALFDQIETRENLGPQG
jgi:hypothetical protein